MEIDGPQVAAPSAIVASRARLRRRLGAWEDGGASRFTAACVERAVTLASAAPAELREHAAGYASDARGFREQSLWCVSAYVAACTAIVAAPDLPAGGVPREERAWQANLLSSLLGLER